MNRPPPRSTLFPYTTLFRSAPTSAARLTSAPVEEAVELGDGDIEPPVRFLRVLVAGVPPRCGEPQRDPCFVGRAGDRKSTRLNSSHGYISYAVFCLKKKKHK